MHFYYRFAWILLFLTFFDGIGRGLDLFQVFQRLMGEYL
jgi:hypothetical protein